MPSPQVRARTWLRGPARTAVREWQARWLPDDQGLVVAPPEFVGIGVQRCGTSWWHSLIEEHPAVEPLGMGAKELHFMDAFCAREVTVKDVHRYAVHFRRPSGSIAGEWTPRYLFDPWAVPALLRLVPDVKLLVMLRDPLERLRSALGHELKHQGTLRPDAVTAAVQRGCYASQLAPLLAAVPEQLLVLQLERCLADTRGQLERTFDFLDLPQAETPMQGQRNAATRRAEVPEHVLDAARAIYRADAERLVELLPDIDLSRWTSTFG